MPIHREGYEEMAERHLREQRTDARTQFRFWVRQALWCWAGAGVGLALAAWGFHVHDVELGWILVDSGIVVTIGSVLAVLYRAIIVARDRGWL